MPSLLILTALSTLLGSFSAPSAYACSVSVNSAYQKNLLIGLAAAELQVDLAKATAISITDYGQNFSGGVGGGACPTHLNTHAYVTIDYKKSKLQSCTISATILRSVQMGDELAPGPFETVQIQAPQIACSTSRLSPFPR